MSEVIKRLLVEIDGNVEKLRRELRKGEAELKGFGAAAEKSGKVASSGADVMATKQATAARAIAATTETIARQGKITGETLKQLITQGAGFASMFGAGGAIAGAIGIATVAMVGFFKQTQEEMAATEAKAAEMMNRFAEMDAKAQARSFQHTFAGNRFKLGVSTAMGLSTPEQQREALIGRGSTTLEADLRRLRQEEARIRAQFATQARAGGGAGAASGAISLGSREEFRDNQSAIEAVTAALKELQDQQKVMLPVLQETTTHEARLELFRLRQKEATEELTKKEKERLAALEEMQKAALAAGAAAEELIQSMVGTAMEKAVAPFDRNIAALWKAVDNHVDVDRNRELIGQLEALRAQAVEASDALSQTDGVVQALAESSERGVLPIVQDFVALNAQIAILERQLDGISGDSAIAAQLRAEIARLKKIIADLTEGVAGAGKPGKGDEGARAATEYARQLHQAADGALQLMQNLGGADSASVSLLRNVGQIAGNLPALGKAFKDGDGFGILSGTLAIAGALSSMFGDSPEEEASRRVQEENTAAIKALTAKVGHIGLGISGTAASGVASELERFLRAPVHTGGKPFDALASARVWAKNAGLDLKELDEIAEAHGITLDGNIDSFHRLAEALGLTIMKLGEFDTSLESQRAQADAEIAIRGITDPAEQARIRRAAYAGRSSALDGVTDGLDLDTAEGREAARKRAIALFETMQAGGGTLGAGQLGALTGDELLQALLDLIAGLDGVEDTIKQDGSSTGTVAGFRGLTEAAGNRLEDRFRSLDLKASEAQVTRLAMLAALQRLAGTPIPVPSIDGQTFVRGGAGAAVIINLSIPVQIFGNPNPGAVTTAVEAAAARVSDDLYRTVVNEMRLRGDLRINR